MIEKNKSWKRDKRKVSKVSFFILSNQERRKYSFAKKTKGNFLDTRIERKKNEMMQTCKKKKWIRLVRMKDRKEGSSPEEMIQNKRKEKKRVIE